MNRLKELRERQGSLVQAGETILEQARADGWTDELKVNFDKTHSDLGEVGTMIDAVMAQREAASSAAERLGSQHERAQTTGDDEVLDLISRKADDPQLVDRLMFKFLRSGFEEFTPEERQQYAIHERQQATAPGADGGFVVGEEFMRQIEDALLMYAGIRNVATVLRTATGEPLHFPTSNGTAEVGEIIDENAAHNTEDIVFAELVLGAWQYSSKMIKSSRQLLQDNFVADLAGFFAKRIGERIGRKQAVDFTVGAGTTEPVGIVPASALGETATSTTAILVTELLNLLHSVDPAYAMNGTWAMNWLTLGQIRSLADTDGFPIWNPVQDSTPGTLYGRPIQILQAMADPAATAIPVVYGALDKYLIRDAGGVQLYRSEHRFFELNQIAWLGIQRSDGNLLDAGTDPVKHLLMAAI